MELKDRELKDREVKTKERERRAIFKINYCICK